MITSQTEFEALIKRLSAGKEIALDCEFHSEGRYYPQLCLVQLAGGDEIALVDPLEVDLQSLGPILANPSIVKILHACDSDVALLARATGQPVVNVFDTQIAAAFLGYGLQTGYAALVQSLHRIALPKGSQYSDWLRRPLSESQLSYAQDDVRHLGTIAATLIERARKRDRLPWITTACAETVTRALAPRDPGQLYLRVGPLRGLKPRQLAVLRELAIWRDHRAAERNRPLNAIAQDAALRQIAAEHLRDWDQVKTVRGLHDRGDGRDLIQAIARAEALPDGECPALPPRGDYDQRVEPITPLLAAALRVWAAQLEIAPAMIANRDELAELAAWHLAGGRPPAPALEVLNGWRRQAAGDALVEFLDGRMALRVNARLPDGVELVPLRDEAASAPAGG